MGFECQSAAFYDFARGSARNGAKIILLDMRGYAAFLQNAGFRGAVYPERCSGLVYGVPLGHGSEVNGAKMRQAFG